MKKVMKTTPNFDEILKCLCRSVLISLCKSPSTMSIFTHIWLFSGKISFSRYQFTPKNHVFSLEQKKFFEFTILDVSGKNAFIVHK